jgi:hypothetical protein
MKAPDQVLMPFYAPSAKQQNARAGAVWEEEILPVVRSAIERLTLKECASLFDASPSNISDALSERDRKRPAMEWLVALLVAAPHAVKLELLAALCDVAGYMAPERKRVLSPEEKLEKYRGAVAKRLAAAELAKIEQEIEES